MKKLLAFLLIFSCHAFADSPGSNIITLKGATDQTKIGNVSDALKVSVTNLSSGTVATQGPSNGGSDPWWVQGALGRTWSLTSADVVTALQGNAPWSIGLPPGASTSALQTQIDSDLVAFEAANHVDLVALATAINSFSSANHSDLSGLQTSLNTIITNTTGLAQESGGHLASIDTKLTSPLSVIDQAISVATFRNLYSSTSVSTSSYLTIISSTSGQINKMSVFDSSGQTMVISYASSCGSLASTANSFLVQPGGPDGEVGFQIPTGNCIGIKAVSATASLGELDVTFIQ